MLRGPEISQWKRHAIILYRFQKNMKHREISEHLNVSEKAIEQLLRRTKRRARSLNLDDLQEAVEVQPRAGRNQRADAGGDLSLTVREGVTIYEDHAPEDAANHHIEQRKALGELDPNIRPLGRQTVWNIRNKKDHCEKDPYQQQPLTRKRKYNRNELSYENVEARLQYCSLIESLALTTTLLICVDEKGYDFGGTANNHVTAPRGEHRYQPTAPVRFRIEQWAAGCGDDCSITRPWHSWDS